MSDFGEMRKVITRKPHSCEYCGRIIPVGSTAHNCRGMWDGEWQNWYACDFCKGDDAISEYTRDPISGDEFNEWMHEQDFAACPKCKVWRGNIDWEWSKDGMSINFECGDCEIEWNHFIGFEAIKEVNHE